MPTENFAVHRRNAVGGVCILDLVGVLDDSAENPLMEAYRQADSEGNSIYLLNFQELSHATPAGMECLILLRIRVRDRHQRIGAMGFNARFRKIFEISRLNEIIPEYSDLEKAAAAVQVPKSHSIPQAPSMDDGEANNRWAVPIRKISLTDMPPEAMNLNVEGREATGPVRGFGSLWIKTYSIRLSKIAVSPVEVIRTWKDNFQSFWPPGTRIFTSGKAGLSVGNSALLNIKMPGGLIVAAGIRVIYADEISFSFITLQGHILSAWITFSAYDDRGTTVVNVRAFLRASDPIMEMALRYGGAAQEDAFWHYTLKAIAARFGAEGYVEQEDRCLDKHFQWPEVKNIRYNGLIRSHLQMPGYLRRKWSGH